MYEPVYGNYVGIVINDQDPEHRNRLQVYIPNISNTLYSDWNERVGQENIEDITFRTFEDGIFSESIKKRLMDVLPWAEGMAPIFGGGTSGHVSTSTGKASTVIESSIEGETFDSDPNETLTPDNAPPFEEGEEPVELSQGTSVPRSEWFDTSGDADNQPFNSGGGTVVDQSGMAPVEPELPSWNDEVKGEVTTPLTDNRAASPTISVAVGDEADNKANQSGNDIIGPDPDEALPPVDSGFLDQVESLTLDGGTLEDGSVPVRRQYAGTRALPNTHEKGYYSKPVVGAKVWVSFYGGDIQRPIYFASVLESNSYAAASQPLP